MTKALTTDLVSQAVKQAVTQAVTQAIPAYVSGWLYVPLVYVPSLPALVRELTITPRTFGDDGNPPPKPIQLYDRSKINDGYIGIPIDWGLAKFPHIPVEDNTVRGRRIRVNKLPDPNHPLAAEGQADFMAQMYDHANNCYSVLAKAGTGTGKTVSALWVAAKRGRSTLVIVPSEFLLDQWVNEISDKLGLPKHHIGIVQQNRCDYKHPIVVGLVHSVVKRDYPEDFYTAFGTIIWDEVHRMGAYTFSQSIGMFPAEAKIAMTATDERKDGADKVFLWYFGRSQVQAKTQVLPCDVKILNYRSAKPVWGSDRGAMIKCLTLDKQRNGKILKLVANLYNKGRVILVIGDSIKQLQDLREALYHDYDVPLQAMGQFTASYYPAEATDPKTGRVVKWADKSKKTKKETTNIIKTDPNVAIVFATYGSFKEGVDIPRLDAGIDVTPRAEGIQVIGRIRRRYNYPDGTSKPKPIWFTIRDTRAGRFTQYCNARIKDYLKSGNTEVYDDDYTSTTPK